MLACGYQSGNMGHIHHQISAYFVGYLTKTLEVNGSGIGAGSGNNQLGFGFNGNPFQLVVINVAFIVYAIGNNVKVQSGEVYRASVGQMPAVI